MGDLCMEALIGTGAMYNCPGKEIKYKGIKVLRSLDVPEGYFIVR